MSDCPFDDPLADSLACLTDAERAEAMRRFSILRPHLIDGVPLAAAAQVADIPLRTAQRWAARYNQGGLPALTRMRRSDADHRKIHPEIIERIIRPVCG